MATWSVKKALTGSVFRHITSDTANEKIYYRVGGIIYEYDAVANTETAILTAASMAPITSFLSMTFFKGKLYVLCRHSAPQIVVGRWDGVVDTLTQVDAVGNHIDRSGQLMADGNYMIYWAIQTTGGSPSNAFSKYTTNGTSWTSVSFPSGDEPIVDGDTSYVAHPGEFTFSWCVDYSGGCTRAAALSWNPASPSGWAVFKDNYTLTEYGGMIDPGGSNVRGLNSDARYRNEYTDDDFATENTWTTPTVYWLAAVNMPFWVGIDVSRNLYQFDSGTQAWDDWLEDMPGADVWIDGAIVRMDNGDVYAVIYNDTTNVWWVVERSEGLPLGARVWSEQNDTALVQRGELPFAVLATPDSLLWIGGANKDILVGSGEAATEMVSQLSQADNYATTTDRTGSVDQSEPLTALDKSAPTAV